MKKDNSFIQKMIDKIRAAKQKAANFFRRHIPSSIYNFFSGVWEDAKAFFPRYLSNLWKWCKLLGGIAIIAITLYYAWYWPIAMFALYCIISRIPVIYHKIVNRKKARDFTDVSYEDVDDFEDDYGYGYDPEPTEA